MLQKLQNLTTTGFAGLTTFRNFYNLGSGASPSMIDVKVNFDGSVEKRLGSNTINATVLVSTGASGFSPDADGSLVTSLTAFWNMNEASGTRNDGFGKINLTDLNTVASASGKLGNAAEFVEANSEALAGPDTDAVEFFNTDFSVTCWVFLVNTSVSPDFMTFVSKHDATALNGEYFLGFLPTENRFRWHVSNSSGTQTSLDADNFGAPATATWIFLRAWYDASSQRMGIAVNETLTDTTAHLGGAKSGGNPIMIGANSGGTGGNVIRNFSNFRIDDVGIWGRVLTSANHTDLFNAGAGNTFNNEARQSGWGSFDYGASDIRYLTIAAGTGIYASSDRGINFVAIATDRTANYQWFERSKPFLIATSEAQDVPLFWDGSGNTFMQQLAVGSAPNAKYAADFAGFLLLMNTPTDKREVVYSDNNLILTDPWDNNFQIPSSDDDEITDWAILNKKLYISTKFRIFRISAVGGNPDFAVQQVKDFGVVPGTWAKSFFQDVGEVLIGLGFDKKVRIFDGSQDRIISTEIEESNGLSDAYLNNIPSEDLDKCHGVFDKIQQVYKLWIVQAPSSETTHMFGLNVRTGSWYPYQNQTFQTAVIADSANDLKLMAVERQGRVHIVDSGNTDAGTAIDDHLDSAFFFGDNIRQVTKANKIHFSFDATSSGTLFYQDRKNFSTVFQEPRDTIILSDTTNTLQVFKSIDLPLTQNIYQWRISSSANTANPWRLNRVDYQVDPKGVGRA